MPETLVDRTVRTAVYVVKHKKITSAPGMSRRVQLLVRETLMALPNQKWQLLRLVLWVVGAAGVGAVSQLLAGSSLFAQMIP